MKTWSGDIVPHIHNLSTWWKWMVSFMPRLVYTMQRATGSWETAGSAEQMDTRWSHMPRSRVIHLICVQSTWFEFLTELSYLVFLWSFRVCPPGGKCLVSILKCVKMVSSPVVSNFTVRKFTVISFNAKPPSAVHASILPLLYPRNKQSCASHFF